MLSVQELTAIKTRQQAAWGSGDYAIVGNSLLIMAELLCEAVDPHSGWKVLDVAAGNGNASLAAARRGCRVISTDYVPAMLEGGRKRAKAEGLKIEFQEADAEDLPFADESFDAVLSCVGVQYTPNQERAAAELMRVCKKGGKIGLANWTPAGFIGQVFKTVGKYVPLAAGVKPSSGWGTAFRLHELFRAAETIETDRRFFVFRAYSAERWLEMLTMYYGPMLRAMGSLEEAERVAVMAELLELANVLNQAQDGTMVVPSEYLEAVITK
jgi:SAM-dependent methyltransferase